MARMSADNLKNDVSNPAKVYLWDVAFANVIGGGNRDHLEVRAQSTAIPGRSFGEILVPYMGTAGIKYPGKVTMTHIWPAVFIEGNDRETWDAVYAWMQAIQNVRTGLGGPDSLIKADIYLRLHDQNNEITNKIKLAGCYPQAVDEVPMAYEDEGNIFYNVTFSYDYWEDDN
jgi:hypothetical protein